jgi:hypothetical protein
MEAAASGSRSKLANTSSTPAPSSDLSTSSILGHGTWGRVILQAAEFADELGREKITTGREHLPQLDERDPAVFQGQAQRTGQPGPAGHDLGMARLPCGLDEGDRGLVRPRI